MHETNKMDNYDSDYEALIMSEIGHSGCPRHIAEQRLIQKNIRPGNAGQLLKMSQEAVVVPLVAETE